MKKLFLLTGFAMFVSSANATNFNYYPDWRLGDKLYYSTFNEGEKWRWHYSLDKPKEETLKPAEQINLCLNYEGSWNHYTNDCVFEEETLILDYIEALEANEPVHYAAPNKQVDPDLTKLDRQNLDWDNYANWSPEKQLFFSTVNQGEAEGQLKPWSFE